MALDSLHHEDRITSLPISHPPLSEGDRRLSMDSHQSEEDGTNSDHQLRTTSVLISMDPSHKENTSFSTVIEAEKCSTLESKPLSEKENETIKSKIFTKPHSRSVMPSKSLVSYQGTAIIVIICDHIFIGGSL